MAVGYIGSGKKGRTVTLSVGRNTRPWVMAPCVYSLLANEVSEHRYILDLFDNLSDLF